MAYAFSAIDVGNQSPPQPFTITNTGNLDLNIGTINLTGANAAEFNITSDNCTSQLITPANTCTVQLIFAPNTTGGKNAKLNIPSNAPATLEVAIMGGGLPGQAELIAPSGTINTNQPTFTWRAVDTATQYLLKITDANSQTTQWQYTAAACPDGTGTCAVTPNISLPAGDAHWQVQTANHLGNGLWSTTLNFRIETSSGILQFSADNYTVNEGEATATITVTRTGGTAGTVSVDYASTDDTAIAGSDYTAVSDTLNWADGDATAKTFTVNIIDDSTVEDQERLYLSLGNVTGGAAIGNPNTAALTITDNDSLDDPSVSNVQVNPTNVQAGDTQTVSWQSTNQAWYFFYLYDLNDQPVNTNAFLSADCQAGGSDGSDGCLGQEKPSTNTSDTWEIPTQLAAGSYKIKVAVWNSSSQSAGALSEAFTVNGGTAGTLQFSSSIYSVTENGEQATITVTRTGGNDGAVSVDYATTDDTAIAGSDYSEAQGTLNWSDGDADAKNFPVTLIDDHLIEGNETLIISLGNVTGGAALGVPDTAVLTIIDNDSINCKQVTEIPTAECKALIALYESTDGANWENNTGWNVTNTPCSWNGVTCKNGHITSLSLGDNKLKGSISAKFFKLKKLKILKLSDNELNDTSLKNFKKLKSLKTLWLNNCQLSGKIPNSLMKLKKLSELDLNDNCLKTKVSSKLKAWLDEINPGWDETQTGCFE
jgi:Leucine-rich repeat (LRR) protein